MGRTISFLLFFLIFGAIYFGIHYFVYFILSKKLLLPSKSLIYLKIFFIVSGLSLIADRLIGRVLKVYWIRGYGHLWLGIIFAAFFVFLIAYVVMVLLPSKSVFITYSAIVLIVVIFIMSMVNGLKGPVIKEIEVPLKNLPPHISGFSIVQLSDFHLQNNTKSEWLKNIVNKTNTLKPDLIVITGDIIDEKIGKEKKFSEVLRGLKSTYGVLAVTGNHEFFSGIRDFMDFAKHSGIRVLRNERVTIAGAIVIVGVEDPTSDRFSEKGPDLDSALAGVNTKNPIILLNHRPARFDEAMKRGVDLQLSGHTHAGQLFPINFLIGLVYKYPYGFYKVGDSYIYTTSGSGLWGPTMRFLNRSEIVKFVLKKIPK